MSGLAAARALVASGRCDIVLHEAMPHAGGRRRSFYDEALGLEVDTGNFPLLSCWTSALSLIDAAGSRGEWREEAEPGVDFADLASGERWRIRPNAGRMPWWLLNAKRRGLRLNLDDYWSARRLLWATPAATVASLGAEQRNGDGAALAAIDARWPQLRARDRLGAAGGRLLARVCQRRRARGAADGAGRAASDAPLSIRWSGGSSATGR